MDRRRRALAGCAFLLAGSTRAVAEPITSGATPPASKARSCGAAGGGLLLPGSDTCLRLGGVLRAEASAGGTTRPRLAIVPSAAGRPASRIHAERLRAMGRIDLDARTQTAYGPARAYLSVRSRLSP